MTPLDTPPRNGLMARAVRVLEWHHLGHVLPLMVLAISLAVTHQLWKNESREAHEHLRDEFDSHVRESARHVEDRMKVYEQMLRGVKALFAARGSVSRDQFRTYVARLRLNENYPGVDAVGFAPIVTSAQWHKHIETMRREGFDSYAIKSEGGKDFYAPTVYIEPFSGGNQHAIGFDMHSDMAYRIAMEQARDTSQAVNTGKILLRETDGHLRAGFLTFAPIYHYREGAQNETPEERRANIVGWVYSVSRMETLMTGILGEASSMIDIEILDGNSLSDETLMFDSDPSASHLISGSGYLFKSAVPMEIASHTWTLAAHSLFKFDSQMEGGRPQFIGTVGAGASLLLALLTWLLVYARTRALQDARQISQSASRYKQMFEDNASVAYLLDPDTGRIVDANAAALSFWGYSLEELRSMNISKISFVPSGKIVEVMSKMKDGTSHRVELYHRLKNGDIRDVEVFSGPLNYQGKTLRYSIAHDITARKLAEDGLRLSMTVFNSVKEAVMVTDPDNRIVMVNPAFSDITGYSAEEVNNENPHMLSSGMHPPAFYLKVWETLHAKGNWSGEVCNRRKSGELYHIWLSIRLVKDEGGKVTHHVAVFHKISKRKSVEGGE
ncbi:MAG: CHASE domain-containing protein [Nitrosomonadales bacterium]|nr:CHASE domain-containing protein [Nitrosomonadales bacterium]